MYCIRSNGWNWHFLLPEDWEKLGPEPDKMTADTRTVKVNPVRGVFFRSGCFIKMDQGGGSRFRMLQNALFPAARREFHTLVRLQQAGIPVTEPVAWGKCSAASCLITREFAGAVSVNDYFHAHSGKLSAAFWENWCSFVRNFIDSGFYHPDFHNGNILYRERDGAFALADVLGITRLPVPGGRRRMRMIVREFAEFLPKSTLLKLLADCGEPAPESFYPKMFRYGAGLIQREWSRRRRQFLSDYPKFILTGGELHRNLDGARQPLPLDGTEKITLPPERAEALRLADFRLKLLNIPRLRIAAFAPPGTLYRETSAGPAAADGIADLAERLDLCGLHAGDFDFFAGHDGRTVVQIKDKI